MDVQGEVVALDHEGVRRPLRDLDLLERGVEVNEGHDGGDGPADHRDRLKNGRSRLDVLEVEPHPRRLQSASSTGSSPPPADPPPPDSDGVRV